MSQILIWDNDGTIMGSQNPMDTKDQAKVILPHVKEVMATASFNFIISGFSSPDSDAQNFDHIAIINKFKELMTKLPVQAAAFSPLMGGIGCYVVVKKHNGTITVHEAHKNPLYACFIGKFKKPNVGMFAVIKDIAKEEFGQELDASNTTMIGDTWHDEEAATAFGFPFLHASQIHQGYY